MESRYSKLIFFLKKIQEKLQFHMNQKDIIHPYKIIGVENDDTFCIHLCKNIFVYRKAEELVKNDEILKGFSQLDVKTITYFAMIQELKMKTAHNDGCKYEIVEQYYSQTKRKEMLVVKDIASDKKTICSAEKIFCNNEVIGNMSALDARNIGYIAGYERAICDNQYKKYG